MDTIPAPVVDWETLLRVSDPLHTPTRQRLRTLKTTHGVSDGVRVVNRAGNRASGSAVYYSALTALASRARHAGDADSASRLTHEGAQIETQFADRLQHFLANHALTDLPDAPFYADLARATHHAIATIWEPALPPRIDFVFSGQIDITDDEHVEITGRVNGRDTRIDLPLTLTDSIHAHTGDHVWVMRELIGSAALLTVLPAISIESLNTETPAPTGEEAMPETEDDAYWTTGPGAPITPAQAAYFANLDTNTLPVARILRPAG